MNDPRETPDEAGSPAAAEPQVLDLGARDPGDRGGDRGRARWQDPRLVWVLAGLAGVVLFASLAGEWTTVTYRPDAADDAEPLVVTAGVANVGAWGSGWVTGVLLLGTALALVTLGPAHLRPTARAVGLAVAGVMLGLLVAAAADLGRLGYDESGLLESMLLGNVEPEIALGRGVYAGYAAVAVAAATLWLARPGVHVAPEHGPPARPAAEPSGATGELTVGPAEPLVYPDEKHEWR